MIFMQDEYSENIEDEVLELKEEIEENREELQKQMQEYWESGNFQLIENIILILEELYIQESSLASYIAF